MERGHAGRRAECYCGHAILRSQTHWLQQRSSWTKTGVCFILWPTKPTCVLLAAVGLPVICSRLPMGDDLGMGYAGNWVTAFERVAYRGGRPSLPERPEGPIRHE